MRIVNPFTLPPLPLLPLLALLACEGSKTEVAPGAETEDAAPGDAAAAPDLAAPSDAAAPDMAAPDLAAPDMAAPDMAAPDPNACHDDLAPGEKVVFYDGFPQGSEGITAGPDALYVSTPDSGEVWRLTPDGGATVFAQVPNALGLAFLSDGRLAVADIGESNEAGIVDGSVYLVDPDGTATEIATGIDSPNFVLVLPDDSLLVSDDFDTRVWHVALDGTVTPALTQVPSPNGMALNLARDALFVVSTFTNLGEISVYPLDAQGLPDEAAGQVLWQNGAAMAQDGVALDAEGRLYVARNIRGAIARHSADGTGEPQIVADGLRTPASLAFGRGPSFDPCSLYVTELLGTRIWRISLGVAGAPLP